MKVAIHGTVEKGKFQPDKPSVFRGVFAGHEGKRVTITVAPFKKTRSLNQNKYLQGVVYPLIAEDTGSTAEEIHEAFKAMFLKPRFVEKLNVPIAGTTTTLSTVEFEEFVEKIRAWSAQNGLRIPTPNEVEY